MGTNMNTLMFTIPLYAAEHIGSILNDSMTRLNLLQSTNNSIINATAPKKRDSLLVGLQDFITEKAEGFINEQEKEKSKRNKTIIVIESDRVFVNDTLLALKSELELNGQFTKFNHIINVEQENIKNASNRTYSFQRLQKQSELFNDYQKQFEKTRDREMAELKAVERNLKHQYQELKQKRLMEFTLIQKNLIENLHCSRKLCQTEIIEIQTEVKNFAHLIDYEGKAHKSFQRELRQDCVNLLINLDEIINKYNISKEKIVMGINKYQRESRSVIEKLEKLRIVIGNYKQVVEEHNEMKRQLRLEAEKEEKLHELARCIQKWWRCMIIVQEITLKAKKPSKKSKKSKK